MIYKSHLKIYHVFDPSLLTHFATTKISTNKQVYSMSSFYTGLLDVRHSSLSLLTLGHSIHRANTETYITHVYNYVIGFNESQLQCTQQQDTLFTIK